VRYFELIVQLQMDEQAQEVATLVDQVIVALVIRLVMVVVLSTLDPLKSIQLRRTLAMVLL
jgi:hypothetical protein